MNTIKQMPTVEDLVSNQEKLNQTNNIQKTPEQLKEISGLENTLKTRLSFKSNIASILDNQGSVSEGLGEIEKQVDSQGYKTTGELCQLLEQDGYMNNEQVSKISKQTPLTFDHVMTQLELFMTGSKETRNGGIMTIETELDKLVEMTAANDSEYKIRSMVG